ARSPGAHSATVPRGGSARREGRPQGAAHVVCLHASASSGRQWRALQGQLADGYQVLSPDLYGSGDSPPWPPGRGLTLADEVARLEPVFEAAGGPFHLIGHSYGGAVAARAALTYPGCFRSLVLVEPVLFGLLIAEDAHQPAAREIVSVCQHTRAAVEVGALDSAAQRFIDYWMGAGTWAGLPPQRRAVIADAMPGVRSQWTAIFAETTPLPVYSLLDLPVLYLEGSKSPPPARAVARLLTQTLPNVTSAVLADAGHMAPLTHPGLVNAAIQEHLERLS
ncbi:MAG TPA: alpha/beta hydrolase, partial [Streptosporangiaceae bacterium]|nr:alpha/beta hydrolase [Streptosporangiaceae bacterium]